MIWKLQMPKSRKIGVSAIFVLGALYVELHPLALQSGAVQFNRYWDTEADLLKP